MKNELMFFEGREVEIFEFEGKVLFNPKHVGEILGLGGSTVRMAISKMNDDERIKLTNSHVKEIHIRKLNNAGEVFITEEGVVQLISKARNATRQRKLDILKALGISSECNNLVLSYKEIEFMDKLEDVLKPFNLTLVRQHRVFDYRLDGYIPKLNIAIEYDENDHKRYSYESQELRQEKIEKELGCRFVRVSDAFNDCYNIGCVIKEIVKEL